MSWTLGKALLSGHSSRCGHRGPTSFLWGCPPCKPSRRRLPGFGDYYPSQQACSSVVVLLEAKCRPVLCCQSNKKISELRYIEFIINLVVIANVWTRRSSYIWEVPYWNYPQRRENKFINQKKNKYYTIEELMADSWIKPPNVYMRWRMPNKRKRRKTIIQKNAEQIRKERNQIYQMWDQKSRTWTGKTTDETIKVVEAVLTENLKNFSQKQ